MHIMPFVTHQKIVSLARSVPLRAVAVSAFIFIIGPLLTNSLGEVMAMPIVHYDDPELCIGCYAEHITRTPDSYYLSTIKWKWTPMRPCTRDDRYTYVYVELRGTDGTREDAVRIMYSRLASDAPPWYDENDNRLEIVECWRYVSNSPATSTCSQSFVSYHPRYRDPYEMILNTSNNKWELWYSGKIIHPFTTGILTPASNRGPTFVGFGASAYWINDLGVLKINDIEASWQPTSGGSPGVYNWPDGPTGTTRHSAASGGFYDRYRMGVNSKKVYVHSDNHEDHYSDACGGTP